MLYFLDKGSQFWRTKRDGSLVSLKPAQIKNFWIGLPPEMKKIDAVYERRSDSRIIFFIGNDQCLSDEIIDLILITLKVSSCLKLVEDIFWCHIIMYF